MLRDRRVGTVSSEKKLESKVSSLNRLSSEERKVLDKKIIPSYIDFLSKANTPERCVNEVCKLAEEAGLVEYEEGMKKAEGCAGFYMRDASRRQFSIVLYGERRATDGISFLVSHDDTPCLNLREHPLKIGPEGVVLMAKPYGGIWNHQWLDSKVDVVTTFFDGQDYKDFSLHGLLSDRSIHISPPDLTDKDWEELFPHKMYQVMTGIGSKRKFLDLLRKAGADELSFFKDAWYVVPSEKGTRIGDMIAAYGHDDRACVYSTVVSALGSTGRTFPCIIYGESKEEIGSTGIDGSLGPFFNSSVDALLKAEGVPEKDISAALERRVFSGSRALSCDCDVALTNLDIDVYEETDDEDVAVRFGKGVSLVNCRGGGYGGNANLVTSEMASYIMDLFKKSRVLYQTSESPPLISDVGGTVAVFFSQRGIPVIDVGPPVGNMHGKNPFMHAGDFAQALKAYSVFIQRKR